MLAGRYAACKSIELGRLARGQTLGFCMISAKGDRAATKLCNVDMHIAASEGLARDCSQQVRREGQSAGSGRRWMGRAGTDAHAWEDCQDK